MKDLFGPESPQDPLPQIRLEELDFAKMTLVVKWIGLAAILLVIGDGATWGRTFSRTGCGSATWATNRFL